MKFTKIWKLDLRKWSGNIRKNENFEKIKISAIKFPTKNEYAKNKLLTLASFCSIIYTSWCHKPKIHKMTLYDPHTGFNGNWDFWFVTSTCVNYREKTSES